MHPVLEAAAAAERTEAHRRMARATLRRCLVAEEDGGLVVKSPSRTAARLALGCYGTAIRAAAGGRRVRFVDPAGEEVAP